MNIKKITDKEMREAKKAGFKRKKPKKPKASATLNQLTAYIGRYNDYIDSAKERAKMQREKVKEQQKRKNLKAQISRI